MSCTYHGGASAPALGSAKSLTYSNSAQGWGWRWRLLCVGITSARVGADRAHLDKVYHWIPHAMEAGDKVAYITLIEVPLTIDRGSSCLPR